MTLLNYCGFLLSLLVILINPGIIVHADPPIFDCRPDENVNALISNTSQNQWAGWIEKLSGETPVLIGTSEFTISTRYSSAMFNGSENAMAYEFIKQTVLDWYPAGWIEEDSYNYNLLVWKNLILTIPGLTSAEESIIISAHLDSTSTDPAVLAPGAEDNASGSAALLEAARVLQDQRFKRTIKLIWFSGEEQGLLGSKAYVADHDISQVLGVVNLDMYGYDANDDGCFEIHVGTLAKSSEVGQCLLQVIDGYQLPLNHDFLTTSATGASDHATFWNAGVAAIEILENYYDNQLPGGCSGADRNPYYHTTSDTIDQMNLPVGYNITKAALATAFSMAGDPPPNYPVFMPLIAR
jgi:leucyl aminopeptidase